MLSFGYIHLYKLFYVHTTHHYPLNSILISSLFCSIPCTTGTHSTGPSSNNSQHINGNYTTEYYTVHQHILINST